LLPVLRLVIAISWVVTSTVAQSPPAGLLKIVLFQDRIVL